MYFGSGSQVKAAQDLAMKLRAGTCKGGWVGGSWTEDRGQRVDGGVLEYTGCGKSKRAKVGKTGCCFTHSFILQIYAEQESHLSSPGVADAGCASQNPLQNCSLHSPSSREREH